MIGNRNNFDMNGSGCFSSKTILFSFFTITMLKNGNLFSMSTIISVKNFHSKKKLLSSIVEFCEFCKIFCQIKFDCLFLYSDKLID